MSVEQFYGNRSVQGAIHKFNYSPIRGLNRSQAAAYIGVSPSFFDELVKSTEMPKPARIGSRALWDIRQLDEALDELFGTDPKSVGRSELRGRLWSSCLSATSSWMWIGMGTRAIIFARRAFRRYDCEGSQDPGNSWMRTMMP